MKGILGTLLGSWVIILSEESGSGKASKRKLGTEEQPQNPEGSGRRWQPGTIYLLGNSKMPELGEEWGKNLVRESLTYRQKQQIFCIHVNRLSPVPLN